MELKLTKISHRFGAMQILDRVSLSVAQGEFVAIIGPSGCGKSTLLNIAGGLLPVEQGRAELVGSAPKNSFNSLTYVFQDFALLPWKTVAENVQFVLEHHAMTATERADRVADVLARTGLSEFANAHPKQLSGGMRQRVGIARALVVNPAILLMDEPLSALDSQTRELLMEDFRTMWRNNNLGALYVTHNLPEALYLADRVVVLSRRPGRVIDTTAIPIPQHERQLPSAQAELHKIQSGLWALIRENAAVADRELLHV